MLQCFACQMSMRLFTANWPLFPCTSALQTPNPPFWTTKTAAPKFPQNGASTPTPCLDKAVHAQRGGGYFSGDLQWKADPWLEACVYACARLLSMAMRAYARLHPNTPHACVRLGSGTQRWTSCIVMHRFSAEKKLVLVEFLFKSTVCRKGT